MLDEKSLSMNLLKSIIFVEDDKCLYFSSLLHFPLAEWCLSCAFVCVCLCWDANSTHKHTHTHTERFSLFIKNAFWADVLKEIHGIINISVIWIIWCAFCLIYYLLPLIDTHPILFAIFSSFNANCWMMHHKCKLSYTSSGTHRLPVCWWIIQFHLL